MAKLTKRVLTKWRKESLQAISNWTSLPEGFEKNEDAHEAKLNLRILELTQELIDQHLLKERS